LGFESESGIPEFIRSDPTRLRQIITNLIGNALKFTRAGGVTVRLSPRLEPQSGLPCEISIAISDTGIGMDADQLERIFDPFAQADTSTTRKYGGTGLGLAISKRLAESLGGGLDVTSEPGCGSTFTVRVAAKTSTSDRLLTADEVDKLATGHHHAKWQKLDLRGTRVLVVDDAKTNRLLIRRLLTDSGAEVETLQNGQLAVERFLSADGSVCDHGIDVVLMDMQMPVLDGYQATRILCQAGVDTPIIAMTANSMVGDDAKCRQSGCCDYLSKPIDLDALLRRVSEWSGKQSDQTHVALNPTARPQSPVQTAGQVPSTDGGSSVASSVDCVPILSPGNNNDNDNESHLPDDWLRQFAIDFIAKVHDQMPLVKRALRQNDWREFGHKVHWIKGSGGTVGLHRLTHLADRCERAVEQNDTDRLFDSFDEIERHVESLVNECGAELPSQQTMLV
ncbi:MAG: ATP-binding protein, partial [Planctomycetota bacterium]